MAQASPRLQLGIELNPAAGEVGPLANYMLNVESADTPMMNLGTSSDRIGTPAGYQCLYLTVAKTFDSRFVPYVSVNYSQFDQAINIPFGVSIYLDKHWVLLPMNDGRKSHLMLTYRQPSQSVSLMWVWFRHPGLSMSWHF